MMESLLRLFTRVLMRRGPWNDEPNHHRFRHRGYLCLLRRETAKGTWCGYVVIPHSHPWGKVSEDALDEMIGTKVHGGITCMMSGDQWNSLADNEHSPFTSDYRHVVLNDLVVGFDCGHAGDDCPFLMPVPGAVYRDFPFVCAEARKLVDLAADAWAAVN